MTARSRSGPGGAPAPAPTACSNVISYSLKIESALPTSSTGSRTHSPISGRGWWCRKRPPSSRSPVDHGQTKWRSTTVRLLPGTGGRELPVHVQPRATTGTGPYLAITIADAGCRPTGQIDRKQTRHRSSWSMLNQMVHRTSLPIRMGPACRRPGDAQPGLGLLPRLRLAAGATAAPHAAWRRALCRAT